MAAKRKIDVFIEINNTKDFLKVLNTNKDKLICAEIYSGFAGSCCAMERLLTFMKLDWSNGTMVLSKVLADGIELLHRFHGSSEPVFMFILSMRVTRVFLGTNGIKFTDIAKEQIRTFTASINENFYDEIEEEQRITYALDELTPFEMDRHLKLLEAEEKLLQVRTSRRAERQAERKYHRALLMVPHLQHLNFVLYWPHSRKTAHPELYEKWDLNNIIMIGREDLELDEEKARDILYSGDAIDNEAAMHLLTTGTSLAICLRILDTEKHFVSLTRKILYEEAVKEGNNKTAFQYYQTHSLTKEQIWIQRKENRILERKEVLEQRARRLSEMQRIARLAIEEAVKRKQQERENKKLELLRAGNLEELERFKGEPEDDSVSIIVPEELPDADTLDDVSIEEDPEEYFPPPGLLIPAFYAPPNDVAKVNGLAILFPKIIQEYVTPQPEFLPPHVLVILHISKRYKAIDALHNYREHVIHIGVFEVISLIKPKHLAYTVKQYDSMDINEMANDGNIKLVLMMSTKLDIPLLQLMDLSPEHVSRDTDIGEEESAVFFSVDYGDDYDQFEDFTSNKLHKHYFYFMHT